MYSSESIWNEGHKPMKDEDCDRDQHHCRDDMVKERDKYVGNSNKIVSALMMCPCASMNKYFAKPVS